jgi:stage V sporulation protein S
MTSSPVEDTTVTPGPSAEVELRVAGRTPTAELASAISHAIYDGKKVTLRAIGAGAVNQAVKGIVVAQGYAAQRGLQLVNRPGFVTIPMDGEDRTAIVFHIFTL